MPLQYGVWPFVCCPITGTFGTTDQKKEIQNLYLDEDVLHPFQRKKKFTESTYYKNLQKSLAQKKERLEDQHKTAKSHKQEQGNSHKPRSVFMYKKLARMLTNRKTPINRLKEREKYQACKKHGEKKKNSPEVFLTK